MFLRTAEPLVVEVQGDEPVAVSFEDSSGESYALTLEGSMDWVDSAMVLESLEALDELLDAYGIRNVEVR